MDMGTAFDEYDDSTHTSFFENAAAPDFPDIANNRRMLYNIMTSEGFTNLPTEWWHYDYGTSFWAFYSNRPAKYTGIFEEEQLFYCSAD
jgi:D-alanyl-D-alanine dipeptidase